MVSLIASYYPKTFAFEGSKLLLDICLVDSKILYFWYVPKSTHKFIIELHALHCLVGRWSYKNKEGVGLFQILLKGETFSSLKDNQVLLGVVA